MNQEICQQRIFFQVQLLDFQKLILRNILKIKNNVENSNLQKLTKILVLPRTYSPCEIRFCV